MEDETEDDIAGSGNPSRGGSGKWTKGVADPDADSRVNIWSLNGYGEPVLTGGMYQRSEILALERTVREYCASKGVTLSELCGGRDHTVHNKAVRGAWQEIARCLPHRTVLSVYRRAMRQHHGLIRGEWTDEEVATLFRLVEAHGRKWKAIQGELGRSATDCRIKYEATDERFVKGKWSDGEVGRLLSAARDALDVPRDDMDVREVNSWSLERGARIPWTAVSVRVGRRRMDCYYKWRQMTRRSNRRARHLGLEAVPMAQETHRFDARREYYRWKAEQDPAGWQRRYLDEYVLPLVRGEGDFGEEKEKDIALLDFVAESRANRPSEVSWTALEQRQGGTPRERWEELVDAHAPEDGLDLPLWKLAKLVKDKMARAAGEEGGPDSSSPRADGAADGANGNAVQGNRPVEDRGNRGGKGDQRSDRKRNGAEASPSVESDVPGVSAARLREALEKIVREADRDTLTSKGARKRLEGELGVDLSSHKKSIKKMMKRAMANATPDRDG